MADPVESTPAGAGGRSESPRPAFDFVVERGKAVEFARATGADASSARELAPITFPVASALWMQPENSAWHGIDRDYRNVLHGEQRFDYPYGPLPVGAALTARQRFGSSFDKPGRRGVMTFTEVITTFWTTDECDPQAIMTSLSITLPPADGHEAAASGVTSVAPAASSATLLRDDLGPLTVTDFVKYQGASGDFNPIHHDTGFALSAGFPSPFAVGMLTAGHAAARVGRVRDLSRLRAFRTRWKSQAWPGDRLSFQVAARDDASDGLDIVVTRDSGDVHMLAWADFA